MKRLAVLISNKGTGTNLQSIINGIKNGKINAKIAIVISDTKESLGLDLAIKNNLKIAVCLKKEDLFSLLEKYKIDFVCLAGWKQIILDEVLDTFPNRIINTHPGLIPDEINGTVINPDGTKGLWNKEKLTNKAMQNFLDCNASYAGCTNHLLTKEFDFGPILGRCFEKIRENDTIETLYKRLKVKENKMYVEVLAKLCNE